MRAPLQPSPQRGQLIAVVGEMAIDPHPVSLEDLSRFAVDHSGHLYWDGKEAETIVSLPWWVNVFIIVGALSAFLTLCWNIYWNLRVYWNDRNSKPHWPR